MRKALKHIIPLCMLLLVSKGSLLAHTLVTTPPLASSIINAISNQKLSQTDLEIFTDQSSIKNTVFEIDRKKKCLLQIMKKKILKPCLSKKTLKKRLATFRFLVSKMPNLFSLI